MDVIQGARIRGFRPLLPGHVKLFGRQNPLPLLVRPLHFGKGRVGFQPALNGLRPRRLMRETGEASRSASRQCAREK